jgi:acyl-CoA thioesterase
MPVMARFDEETSLTEVADGVWETVPGDRWNIGDTANGGYAVSPVLRAMRSVAGRPDPWSVTTHYLAPLRPDGSAAEVRAELVKPGRMAAVVRGRLHHDGRDRLEVTAAFGDLSRAASEAPAQIALPAPPIPPPAECVDRSELSQGVDLPILDRLDVRIHPDRAVDAGSDDAVMEGWIRFADGADPTSSALVLFADAFPPSLYPRLGRVGWVPTLELTVQVRRRPAPGWIQARLECDDLCDGRMVETGTLWDSTGAVVARSRQLGLLLT